MNGKLPTDFPKNMMDMDIGNYDFDNVKQYDDYGFVYLYSGKDPNVRLVFNEDRMAVILYLKEGKNAKATSWRMGQKHERTFKLDEIDSEIFK